MTWHICLRADQKFEGILQHNAEENIQEFLPEKEKNKR
jgi:hypothetical protein